MKGDDAQASITFSLSAGARAFLMMAFVFVAPQANPSAILLSGNIFLHSFVKWSPAENAKLCSAMKIVKYKSDVVTCSLSDRLF